MVESDYKVYNLPALLNRSVKKQDPADSSKWIVDSDWYRDIREKYFALFQFLQSNKLVSRKLVTTIDDVSNVVVRHSELTDFGRRFVKSGIDERWLKSFDRPGSKKEFSNVAYMQKAIEKLQKADLTRK